MTSRLTTNKFIICLVLTTFSVGCTTMRSLPATDTQSLASQIMVGDKISIVRNDLTDITFNVSIVSDEGIGGEGVFIAYSDIQQVQVQQFSTGKTLGLVAAAIAVLALALASSAGGIGGFYGPPVL